MLLSMSRQRRPRMSLVLIGLSLGLFLLPELAQAQGPAQPPQVAIQNARIVTVSGRVYDRGTIVMEDGLITAVGSSVQAPSGVLARHRGR